MSSQINDYQQALEFVFGFVDLSRTHQENIAPENFELGRMAALMQRLDRAHLAYPTLHIAGTKGKGSVAVFCSGALQAASYRVGLYTSPHLIDFRERIQIDRQPISEMDFVRLVSEIEPVVAKFPGITSYEIQTALAFGHFAREEVDIAVIEVGMGGRLDSTNIISPLVSVITSISLDHTAVLGNTLAEIAAEKAGIIKAGIPVVSAPQAAEVQTVLTRTAKEMGTTLINVEEEIKQELISFDSSSQKIRLQNNAGEDIILDIKLLGPHQIENAATAYSALSVLEQQGWIIGEDAIIQGFGETTWAGRFERVGSDPVVILDGAHNRYSAHKLAKTLEIIYPTNEIILIFGASEDKDIHGMFVELLPKVKKLVAVRSSHPRAAATQKLVEMAENFNIEIRSFESIELALGHTLSAAKKGDVIVAAGSLYLIGEVKTALNEINRS